MSLTINPVEGQMEWRVKENKVILLSSFWSVPLIPTQRAEDEKISQAHPRPTFYLFPAPQAVMGSVPENQYIEVNRTKNFELPSNQCLKAMYNILLMCLAAGKESIDINSSMKQFQLREQRRIRFSLSIPETGTSLRALLSFKHKEKKKEPDEDSKHPSPPEGVICLDKADLPSNFRTRSL